MAPAMRFLKYETCAPVTSGLLHQASNLRCLLHEAHATGRLAVLPSLRLRPEYNFGVRLDWRWERYFDLPGSSLIDSDGRKRPLPLADPPPEHGVRMLRVRGKRRIPDRARGYPLVVRRISHPQFAKVVPVDTCPPLEIDLCASAPAVALAQRVITLLERVGDGHFVAVHVRRGDRVSGGEYPAWMTEPAHLVRSLQEREVRDGAVLYVASDERSPDFWRPLQKRYRLFRYSDFPPLRALVSRAGPAPPDNYLLFRVELEVLRRGRLRLGTFPTTAWRTHGSLVEDRPRKPFELLTRWRWRLKGGGAGLIGGWFS